MPSSGFNLTGNVELNAGNAIRAASVLGARFKTLSENSRTTSATLKATATAMNAAASAADKERRSLVALAEAQARVNKVNRESIAATNLTKARAGAVTSGAVDKSLVASGQAQLLQNKALTETVRQRIAAEDGAGRAAVRNSQIANAATRTQIAQERLLLAQEKEARAARTAALGASTISAERAAQSIGHLGSASLHVATISGAAFIGLAVNAAVMERQFANVVRTSDIVDMRGKSNADTLHLQAAATQSLRLQFDALAQALPLSYKELTEIGTAANQLGVHTKDLASFTRTVAQFSATTGVSVDASATAFGRLDSLIPDIKHNYEGLADSINKVGVNSVATDQQIINIASQISGVAASAGLGYKSIIGFSGALASVSVSPYLARGLTTRLFTDLTNAVSDGGSELTKFAQLAGMSAEQFKTAWGGTQSQKQGVLLSLFDGIRKAGPDAVEVLKNIGVSSVLDQPALIRLANAADSTGKAGALLAQTFGDANNAIDENAKQFAVISGTVSARAQVALNRIQILLRNIGESNLGPIAAILNSISDAALRMSQNLDKPFKLLGAIQLPFSNGDALGFAALATGAIAGFTLLVGVLSKVVAAFLRVREAASIIRGTFGGAGLSIRGYTTAAEAAVGANDALAASMTRVARANAASRSLVVPRGTGGGTNYQTGQAASNAINAQTSMFNRGTLLARAYQATLGTVSGAVGRLGNAYTSTVGRMQGSSNGLVRALGSVGTRGTGAFAAIGSAAGRATSSIGRVASGVGSFLGGPLGITILAATAVQGMVSLDNAMKDIGSKAGDVSVAIHHATTAAQILGSVQVSSATDGIAATWDRSTQKFMSSTTAFQNSLKGLGQGGVLNDFAAKFTSIFSESKLSPGFNYTTQGLDKIDAGFKNLADSGAVDDAIKGIQTLFKGATKDEVSNALAHMSGTTELLTARLNESGKSAGKNNENVIKLAQSNAVLSSKQQQAAAQADALANAFHGDVKAAQDYITATQNAANHATDLNAAFKDAGGAGGGLTKFFAKAKQQYNDFVTFSGNSLKIAARIGSDYINDISALDPALVAEVAKGGNGAMDKLKEAFQRKDVVAALQANIGGIANDPQILTAFGRLSVGAQTAIIKSLGEGSSIPDAFRAAGQKGVDAYNAGVKGTNIPPIKLKVDDGDLAKNINDASVKAASGLAPKIKIDGDPLPAITKGEAATKIISDLRGYIKADLDQTLAVQKGENTAAQISRLKATMTIFGDPAPAQGKGQSAADYIGRLQARIIIDANPALAHQTAAQEQASINKLTAQLNINGDSQPARKEGETAQQAISRLVARLVVDADPNPAKRKGADAANVISRLKGIMTILGVNAPAIQKGESTKNYIDRLKGMITILGDPTGAVNKANQAKRHADVTVGTMKINGDNTAALAKAAAAKARANGTHGTIKINGDNSAANAKTAAAAARANGTHASIKVSAATGAAEAAINYAARNRTTFVHLVQTGSISAQAGRNAAQFNATGGPISGPGTGTSDSILSYLSNGEYVIRAAQARKHRRLLDAINYGAPGYATGGSVAGGSARYQGTPGALHSAYQGSSSAFSVTELSAYDRHLLQTIADNIGVTIAPQHIAGATSSTYRGQARRGNG